MSKTTPSDLQITAEQIIQEAYERTESSNNKPLINKSNPISNIKDSQELADYQRRKRNEFESYLSRNRFNFGQWIRYGEFEVEQRDFDRFRSVFERALEVDNKAINVWLRYINIEIKNKNINHARNLLERSTGLLPKVDKLWYQYILVEENLRNILGVRLIFEKWLTWKPSWEVWQNYIDFETRYKEFDNVRLIFEKFVIVKPDFETWLLWIEFEKEFGDSINVNNVFKLAIDSLNYIGKLDHRLLISYIRFKITNAQTTTKIDIDELYNYCLSKLTPSEIKLFDDKFANIQKQFGLLLTDRHGDNKNSIERSIIVKRLNKYQDELATQSKDDYYKWWLFLDLVIGQQNNYTIEEKRKFFESVISHGVIDPAKIKQWKYIWLRYINWEELQNKDIAKSRHLYQRLTSRFSSSTRLCISFSDFEIRNDNLVGARRILGKFIGQNSKTNQCEGVIYYYINLERNLREFDRVRKLFHKLIELYPGNFQNWLYFSNFELSLGDLTRSQEILKLLYFNNDQVLNTFEMNQRITVIEYNIELCLNFMKYKESRILFDKLVSMVKSAEIWIKRALFELQIPNDEQIKRYQDKLNEEGIVDVEQESEFEIEIEVTLDSINRVLKQFKKTETADYLSNESRFLVFQAYSQFVDNYKSVHQGHIKSNLKMFEPRVKHRVKLIDGINVEYIDYEF